MSDIANVLAGTNDSNEQSAANFATVGSVEADGITLIFDGQSEATQKRYKCNTFCKFEVGQRVRIIKDKGTYVVEYPVGTPTTTFKADAAITADTANNANSANSASNADNAYKLNNKTEDSLVVYCSNYIKNQYNAGNSNYYIRLKYNTISNTFYVATGTASNPTWHKIQMA